MVSSISPIILAIIIGSIMLSILVGLGYKRLNIDMPVAGSCSFAIAAACHRPIQDIGAAYRTVQWGCVGYNDDDIGHCCFTTHHVEPLIVGKSYAGI